MAVESRRSGGEKDTKLWQLLRAVAAGDETRASHLLAEAPRLALDASAVGATRSAPLPYFFRETASYVHEGDTALHVAAAAYRADIARTLVGHGADVGRANRRGAQPIHYASVGNPDAVTWAPDAQAYTIAYLISVGADPNAADKSGVTALHRAVRTRCGAAVHALLTNDADARRANGSGSRPLHLAVQNTGRGGSGSAAASEQQRVIIRLLLGHGARLSDRDGRGRTAGEIVAGGKLAHLLDA